MKAWIVVGFYLVIFLPMISQAKLEVKVAMYYQEPWWYLDENKQLAGIRFEKVKCVFDNMVDVEFTAKNMPWGRGQKMIELGEMDAMFAARSKKRDAYAVISTFYNKSQWLFYSLKKNRKWKDLDDIKQTTQVAARLNTSKENMLKKDKYKRIFSAKTIDNLIQVLYSGRIDAVLESDEVMEFHVPRLQYNLSELNTVLVKEKPAGLYVSKVFLRYNSIPKFF